MKKGIWVIVILSALTLTAGIAIKIKTNKIPENEINIAGKKLFEARMEKSADFAPKHYQQALIYYDSAMVEWSNQNRRFIFLRNYEKVTELAKKSFESSLVAINEARKNISETEENIAFRLKKLGAKIKNFDKIFDTFPMTKKQRSEVEKCITVELGENWIGDKQQRGDKTTPEGLYKIIEKKENGQTNYYKALVLDYPNEEDRNRFALNKKNGIIKREAGIGNFIEIHGHGGKGVDWTDGCIAVSNPDMDVIFNLCPVETKVTIVGSTKTMDEFLSTLK